MFLLTIVFYIACIVTAGSAFCLLFVKKPMHGALYLTSSMLALSIIFYCLGAPFLFAMQLILYIGAVIVLFVFFIMLSPLDKTSTFNLNEMNTVIPVGIIVILTLSIITLFTTGPSMPSTEFSSIQIIDSKSVGSLLFTHYKLAIELISTLLLAAMVAVIYFAKNIEKNEAE
ncbi:NADH-quinone oxidoreductase subunit J [Paraphotobacterium marinum]|uniref:NADH-quinone oxidoreductase subunit J n=1 Tax=Paraphotobacterium marinum TaxID=1755811 RepID=A0A220VDT8_9GAMM|nr:NADH-quinone oxidoreductase subunit J [Paraphotobacterium marinum]ASK78396.1 NADH-quinone oxidoreductase subunit J [Paraphotobacterium marinum]